MDFVASFVRFCASEFKFVANIDEKMLLFKCKLFH